METWALGSTRKIVLGIEHNDTCWSLESERYKHIAHVFMKWFGQQAQARVDLKIICTTITLSKGPTQSYMACEPYESGYTAWIKSLPQGQTHMLTGWSNGAQFRKRDNGMKLLEFEPLKPHGYDTGTRAVAVTFSVTKKWTSIIPSVRKKLRAMGQEIPVLSHRAVQSQGIHMRIAKRRKPQ